MEKFYMGIDIGGTMLKGGVLNEDGKLIVKHTIETEAKLGNEKFLSNVVSLIDTLIEMANLQKNQIVGVGMGIPGMIDSAKGEITFSANLYAKEFPIRKLVAERTGFLVKITNDANAACLGEVKFGGEENVKDAVMITLGTGVGGGVIANGMLIEGNRGAGAELGHSLLIMNGERCSCGRLGCVEAYVSATALIRDTIREMQKNASSILWQKVKSLDEVNGKLAFDNKEVDECARVVVEHYMTYLGEALVSFSNIFRPEVIILGGGVANQGDAITLPLQQYVDTHLFACDVGPKVKVKSASLKNDAGTYGAAALFMS